MYAMYYVPFYCNVFVLCIFSEIKTALVYCCRVLEEQYHDEWCVLIPLLHLVRNETVGNRAESWRSPNWWGLLAIDNLADKFKTRYHEA